VEGISLMKIKPLKLHRGALTMVGVCESHSSYLIANYTRNTKGFMSINDVHSGLKSLKTFKVGDLLSCVVSSQGVPMDSANPQKGADKYYAKGSGNLNRKLQLVFNLKAFNSSLSIKKIVKDTCLIGQVSEIEEKGYLIDLGFTDNSQAFLPFG
jgi:hypothetical protein